MEQVVHTQNPINPQPVVGGGSNPPVMRKITPNSSKMGMIIALISLAVVLAGVGTGYVLSGSKSLGKRGESISAPGTKQTENEAGKVTEDCKDEVEGNLEEGGIEGEGTHHLVRSADKSKDVYLGSTVIDLNSFVGKKVKVTGQTMSAKTAGWLMDVCKVKVVE